MNVSKKSLILLALSALASAASAGQNDVYSTGGYYSPNAQGFYVSDNRSTAEVASMPSNDGDGALHFSGNSAAYVSYGAYPAYGGTVSSTIPSLGTLGSLVTGTMSGDFFRNSASSTINPYLNVAVKLTFSGNRSLTWENAYNSALTTQDAWFSQMLNGDGKWWLRGAGLPAETNENLGTLLDWANGKSPTGFTGAPLSLTSDVLGYTIGFGSGVGTFDGAFDHLSVNYTGGTSTTFNFRTQAAPEPAPLAGLALGAVAFLRRRKRA